MAWSAEFLALINQPSVPGLRYVLRSLPSGMVGAATTNLQLEWACVSSVRSTATVDGLIGGLEVGGAEVRPPSWDASIGATTVTITSPSDRLRANARRGQWVELLAGSPSWDESRYQRIALGVLAQMTGQGLAVTMQIRDPLSGLGSRPTRTTAEYPLFAGIGTATDLTSGYATTDGSILVTSTAGLDQPNDGTLLLYGAVLITPTTGDPFYLRWRNPLSSAISLDVQTADQHGTTRTAADVGDAVTEVALVYGHPAEMATQVLASTGTPLRNGPYDILPALWGYGLHRSLLDEADIAATVRATQPSSGADDWEVISREEQADGLSWLQSWLSIGGYFLAFRQGCVTIRYAPNLLTGAVPLRVITDDDIMEVETWEAWDGDYEVQYDTISVRAAGTDYTSSGVVHSMPAEQILRFDAVEVVFDNAAAIAGEIRTRLRGWATQLPEVITLRLRGWSWGAYSVGDVLGLTTRTLRRRGGTAYEATPAMVCRVAPSWAGAPTTSITLRLLPPEGV